MKHVLVQERTRPGFQAKTRTFLEILKGLIDEERDYWPITVRRVFYAYIGRFALPSDSHIYTKVSDVLHRARILGEVPWEALEDRTRAVLSSDAWDGREGFVEAHKRWVLTDYRRDLQQGQAQVLEVWIEKDALAHIVHRAADPYTVSVSVARGFSSGSFKHGCAERIRETAIQTGRRTIILYFGDLDPSGAYMPVDLAEGLKSDMGLRGLVEVYHCGLLPEHVDAHHLPSSIDAFKEKDPRAGWFVEEFGAGQKAVELDALPPAQLAELVRVSIEAWLDLDRVAKAREAEENDREPLRTLRDKVVAAFG